MAALEKVSFSYGEKEVLREVTLRLPAQGVVCLYGASGGGKTTLLRLLAGLEKPAAGRVTGTADKKIAMVFQEDRLLPWLSAADNVAAALRGEDARARAVQALEEVGLAASADERPAALSGGMRRRVAIARALAFEGDILLLDEPFNGLDEKLWRPLAQHIAARYADRLTVLVTHVQEHAQAMGAAFVPMPPLPVAGELRIVQKICE